MDYMVILAFMKRHYLELVLGVVVVHLLGIIIYLFKREAFGVRRFEKEFVKLFKPIRKKQRKNREIPLDESKKTLEALKKLYVMHEKIFISLNNAQNLSEKDRVKYLAKLNTTFIKFQRFEKYVETYHDQISTYYNIENVPLRVATKLQEFEDVWK